MLSSFAEITQLAVHYSVGFWVYYFDVQIFPADFQQTKTWLQIRLSAPA